MVWGNKPTDGGNLCLTSFEKSSLIREDNNARSYLRRYYGSKEFIRGEERWCIWVDDDAAEVASMVPALKRRFDAVATFRLASKAAETRPAAAYPHKFRQIQGVGNKSTIIVPSVSSENRPYLPVGLLPADAIVSNLVFALYDAPLWNLAVKCQEVVSV